MGSSIIPSADRADVVDGTHISAVKTSSSTPQEAIVGASKLARRQIVYITNLSTTETVYWGTSSLALSGTNRGTPIRPGRFASFPFGKAPIWFASTNNAEVVIGEVS